MAEDEAKQTGPSLAELSLHFVLGCCTVESIADGVDCPGRVREVYDAVRAGQPMPFHWPTIVGELRRRNRRYGQASATIGALRGEIATLRAQVDALEGTAYTAKDISEMSADLQSRHAALAASLGFGPHAFGWDELIGRVIALRTSEGGYGRGNAHGMAVADGYLSERNAAHGELNRAHSLLLELGADQGHWDSPPTVPDRIHLLRLDVARLIAAIHGSPGPEGDLRGQVDRAVHVAVEQRERLAALEAKDKPWNDAIDWLLNSRHTADPDIQSAFWGMVDGQVTRQQADAGVFEYDADGNASVKTYAEPALEAAVSECGEYGPNNGICGEAVPDGVCSEHGEVGPPRPPGHSAPAGPTLDELSSPECGKTGRPTREGCDGTCAACTPDTPTEPRVRDELCPHGILIGMMVCPACEPEQQAEAEASARRHAARTSGSSGGEA